MLTRCGLCLVLLVTHSSCTKKTGPTPSGGKTAVNTAGTGKSGAVAAPPRLPRPRLPRVWPKLGPAGGAVERTKDGIPVMRLRKSRREGRVTWVVGWRGVLEDPQYEATDGRRIYFAAADRWGTKTDLLIRDGRVYNDILHALSGGDAHPGGCAAASDGALLLAAPRPSVSLGGGVKRSDGQALWLIKAGGKLSSRRTPKNFLPSARCRAWLDKDGSIALITDGLITWDGRSFAELRDWNAPKMVLGSARGPRFCFVDDCQGASLKPHPAGKKLQASLACDASWAASGPWVAGVCISGGRAVRMRLGGKSETTQGVPKVALEPGPPIALTDRGDLVIGLSERFKRHVVWPAGGPKVSPVRELEPGDVLAHSSPTLLVKGPVVPKSSIGVILLGRDIGFSASGVTLAYSEIKRTAQAHRARAERAGKALGGRRLVVVHDAVVDLACGGYLRSPIGVDTRIPPGHPRRGHRSPPRVVQSAVTRSPRCLELDSVSALPADPDLLLARTPSGELWAAWLPPASTDPKRSKPGTGWTKLGRAEAIDGDNGVPAPGADTSIVAHTWQYGGAAVVRAAKADLLLTSKWARTLPRGTRAMAIAMAQPRAWGALGSKLVVCDKQCRVLDPGVAREIIAVVPRTAERLLLGYADGRVGVYEVPPKGGQRVVDVPLARALEGFLARKPRPTPAP